ncbi:MAG: rod shape-determining protein RodA [Methylococcaceae bacterium]|nr:rod shape-determining protein RodA [Methylococcaceae bacterium]MCI0668030.1 rod shape-determining protein RodA [Methylococcaceae bacterium]MCI0732232.1 rod shape-determining protein RodA [Methylococcaceae bacterium]
MTYSVPQVRFPLPAEPPGGFFYKIHVDLTLLAALILLSSIGFVILYSAGGQHIDLVFRQATRLGIAYATMLILAQIPPRHFRHYAPGLFVIGIGLLAAVLIMGEIGKGAQRWLNLGLFRFQPSEMIKISTPMMISWYLAENPLPPRIKQILITGILIIVPTLLIAKQPDLGTALLVAASGAAVLFVSGIRWRFLLKVGIVLGGLTPLLWHFMREYQRARILTFLNPEADPLGNGYHIIQSKIAIGSGGIYGKGWLNGTQAQLEFLPERSTDFIFAVFAEEFGLLGCLTLLLVYLMIICRCLYIALQAQDTFSRLLAGSLSITFFVYVFVNIGMVIGILPVVGVPLPLISYGGTSMVTLLAGFGILMSIHTHRRLLPI